MSSTTQLRPIEAQAQASAVLNAALGKGLSHAYLFHGPEGVGKRDAARTFAAEILAWDQPEPDSVRRRVQAGAHPDLTWIVPRGAHEILVEDIRVRVVSDVQKRPFEAARRVFVITRAELMNDEATNALLKTLEEAPSYAHLILTSSAPDQLLDTVRSRCQPVRFGPVAEAKIESNLCDHGVAPPLAKACARLSQGNLSRARFLASSEGQQLREQVRLTLPALTDSQRAAERPWLALLGIAEHQGEDKKKQVHSELDQLLESMPKGRERQALKREYEQTADRTARRTRTATLDLELHILGLWLRDLLAFAQGAEELVFGLDGLSELKLLGINDTARLIEAIELCNQTRQRLRQNVSEELALDALYYRLHSVLAS